MQNQEKPLLRPFEKFFLFVALVMIVAFFLQSKTGKVWQTTERDVFTPGLSAAVFSAPKDGLEPLAEAFSKPDFESKAADFWQKTELPEAEKSFFQQLREQKKGLFEPEKTSVGAWLDVLRAARKTYRNVNEAFDVERLSPRKDSAANAEKTFAEFEKTFGVPASESRDFSKNGPRSPTDWAIFLEEKMRLTH